MNQQLVLTRGTLVSIAALLVVYLANCLSPLRLNFDTIRYLHIKEWIEAGRPSGHVAATDFLPHGYVWFLLLLEKVNACHATIITLSQLIFFLGGCWLLSKIGGYDRYRQPLLVFALLNWMALKFVITPLSEMQFFFTSSLSLFFFYKWQNQKRLWDALLCIGFTALAIITRTAGVTLIIAFLIYYAVVARQHLRRDRTMLKYFVVTIIVALLFIVFFADALHIGEYIEFLMSHFQNGVAYTLANNVWLHLIDFASVFLNQPSPKVPLLPPVLVRVAFFLAGLFFTILVVYLLLKKTSRTPLFLRMYIGVYLLMIFNWPYFEPRFFLPVFPLLILMILENFEQLNTIIRKLLRLYLVVYAITGIAALSYYSYTSFNKRELARRQDAGIWRNEYETLFYGKPVNDTATSVRQPIVNLLRKYN
jgi:hypothetical protein